MENLLLLRSGKVTELGVLHNPIDRGRLDEARRVRFPAQKSAFEYVVYDSEGTEKTFAEDLEANEAVKVYAKLPAWFKVPTPLGTYNPDWAVLIDQDGEEKLYFVVETKSSEWWDDLRPPQDPFRRP